jgi:hypothetical protein
VPLSTFEGPEEFDRQRLWTLRHLTCDGLLGFSRIFFYPSYSRNPWLIPTAGFRLNATLFKSELGRKKALKSQKRKLGFASFEPFCGPFSDAFPVIFRVNKVEVELGPRLKQKNGSSTFSVGAHLASGAPIQPRLSTLAAGPPSH